MTTITQAMRHPPDPATFMRMTTPEMRQAFLLEDLFEAGRVKFYYSYIDRAVIGVIELHPAGFEKIFQQEGLPHFGGCHAREGRRVGRMTHRLGYSSHVVLR